MIMRIELDCSAPEPAAGGYVGKFWDDGISSDCEQIHLMKQAIVLSQTALALWVVRRYRPPPTMSGMLGMDRELLAYLIIAAMVVAFAAVALHTRHNSRERKSSRQKERERQQRASSKVDLP